jgi:dethiobiotin synthetase
VSLAVVGTDTGVGKTVVTAALVGALRDRGRDARAVKPVQTGYPSDDDAGFVRRVCGEDAAVALRRFEEPLAPAVAARREGSPIAFGDLAGDVEAAVASADVAVVEGAGGLRVPLAQGDLEIIDLVAAAGLPAVLVARSGLGTLNHTALSVEALRRRSIPLAGIVLNRFAGESVAERTNPDELRRMCGCPVAALPERSAVDGESIGSLGERLLGSESPISDWFKNNNFI